jgi:hypothetical protein
VAHSVTHLPALRAIQACDVVFGCLDHGSARLALASLAVLFAKPFIDLATGFQGEGEQQHMGADVRLLVPGERCFLCLGGLADLSADPGVLGSADAERRFYSGRRWQQERAGRLRSLNQLAVALALRVCEDFVAERVAGSNWLHAEFDRAGQLSVTYPSPEPRVTCRLCRLVGMAEEGLPEARAVFAAVSL